MRYYLRNRSTSYQIGSFPIGKCFPSAVALCLSYWLRGQGKLLRLLIDFKCYRETGKQQCIKSVPDPWSVILPLKDIVNAIIIIFMCLLSADILHTLHFLYLTTSDLCCNFFPPFLLLLLSEIDVIHPEIQLEQSLHFSHFNHTETMQKQMILQLCDVFVSLNLNTAHKGQFICSVSMWKQYFVWKWANKSVTARCV